MKIASINTHQKFINKKTLNNSSNISKSNNVSFMGLFPTINNPFNAQKVDGDVQMRPMQEYEINEDAKFDCCGYTIDLYSDELKEKVKYLRAGEGFVIGRNAQTLRNMPDKVSRYHLRITRNNDGRLTACDLNSMNGTKIKSNVMFLPPNANKTPLIPGKYYLLPYNAVISANKEKIRLNDLKKQIESLKEGQCLIVGRGYNSNIRINNETVSNRHLSLEPFRGRVLVRDLYSTNGSSFEYCENYSPLRPPFITDLMPFSKTEKNDYSNITEIKELKKGVPTKIPNDCQIYLGHHFTLDVRNPKILEMLNQKGKIKIGRNMNCDLVVSSFYSHVSREHLQLEKKGGNIIATDLNASTSTQIIPKNKIQPFNGGVVDIEIGQHNIGDCYLLANLYALSRTPKGQEMIKNMVSVDDDGNYIVKLYSNLLPIVVKPEQLDGQYMNGSNKICVSGDLGVRAIERAYGRMISEHNGDGYTLFMQIDDGGYPDVALRKLTGLESKTHKLRNTNVGNLLYDISSKGLENYVLTCSTPRGKYNGYVDSQHRFDESHAYGIKNIDPYNQTIEIINPHNTMSSKVIHWSEFQELFDYMYVANLKNSYNF